MPYDDRERMAGFYESVFGWKTQMLGEDMGHYVLATTTETDEKGPKEPGTINGGFYKKRPEPGMQNTIIVIAVDDINKSIKNVDHAGGKLIGDIMEIPGVGKYISFTDTEGNHVGMLQPIPRNWHAQKD